MTRLSAAEQYLLDQIRNGDAEAWRQLVGRYHGRLMAFAARDLPSAADAEDAVQETFVSLIQGLNKFRSDASLETYLFVILRRRMVDAFRRRGGTSLEDDENIAASQLRSRDMTASWYLERDETHEQRSRELSEAVETLVSSLRTELKFDDLLLVDLLFGAQQRNKDVAANLNVDEKWIALRKHRFTKRLSSQVTRTVESNDEDTHLDTTLTEIWSDLRPTCPKRSTLGKYLLGTLDATWQDYVQRHIDLVACPFCSANLSDLQAAAAQPEAAPTAARMIQSTIGFFRSDPESG